MTEEAHVRHHADAPTYVTPQEEDLVVLERGDEPGGDFDLLEFTIPTEPGAVPLHVHHENDEAFYVLEGELQIQVGDDRHTLTAGSYAYGPRGVPHAYRNTGNGPARILVVYTPGNFVQMTEDLEELGPIDLDDESQVQEVLPIMEEYGLEIVGPELGAE